MPVALERRAGVILGIENVLASGSCGPTPSVYELALDCRTCIRPERGAEPKEVTALIDALRKLALPAPGQCELELDGCRICSLVLTFERARSNVFENDRLPILKRQALSIEDVVSAIRAVPPADRVCREDVMLSRASWGLVRTRSEAALREFGYGDEMLSLGEKAR